MKRITILSLTILIGSVELVSCSDFLDADNKSAGTNADTYFATAEGIAAAKAQAFYTLRSNAINYNMNCAGTDLYIPVRGKDPGGFQTYSLAANNSDVESFYSNCYDEIKYGMFYAEKAGEGTVGNNEGRFIRDYAYYQLTQQFGGVPYIDHYVSDANRNYPKNSLDSIYTVMENDLESIYNSGLLPETDSKGNISKQAVAALLAKYYLADGWDANTTLKSAAAGTYTINSTDKFKKAAEWAVKAINGVKLTQNFEKKWSPSNEGNPEDIWSIQYDRASYPGDLTTGGHSLQNQFGDYYGDPTKTGYKAVGSTGAMSEKALYLWQKGDERYNATFMTKIYNYNGTWGTTGYYGYYNGDTTKLHLGLRFFPAYTTQAQAEAEFNANKDKYTKGSYNNQILAFILSSPATEYTFKDDGSYTKQTVTFDNLCLAVNGGACIKKFDDPNTQQQNSTTLDYRDIVIFDISDMYLTVAEAYLMAGDESEALNYVNQVRSRANAGTLSSFSAYEPDYSITTSFGSITPLDVILDERARELYGQQVRWVDLRRTKQLVRYNLAFNKNISNINDMSNTSGEIKWLRPIPEQAINGNNALSNADQNPGY